MPSKTDRQLLVEAHANVAVLLDRTAMLPQLYSQVATNKLAIKFLAGSAIAAPIAVTLRLMGLV